MKIKKKYIYYAITTALIVTAWISITIASGVSHGVYGAFMAFGLGALVVALPTFICLSVELEIDKRKIGVRSDAIDGVRREFAFAKKYGLMKELKSGTAHRLEILLRAIGDGAE